MKFGKSRGAPGGTGVGVSGILENYNAYQRWSRTLAERVRFLSSTLDFADMTSENNFGNKHKDQKPIEVRRSEMFVKKVMNATKNFLNPFDVDDKMGCMCFLLVQEYPLKLRKV